MSKIKIKAWDKENKEWVNDIHIDQNGEVWRNGVNWTDRYEIEVINDANPSNIQRLFGVVKWVNGHPILDNMKYFETKEKCIKYIGIQTHIKIESIKVEYTIIRLKKSEI